MSRDIADMLDNVRAKPKRRQKPKNYESVVTGGNSKVGDVVYMPSHPDVRMTVTHIPYCNRAAGHTQMVVVQWLDANLHFVTKEMKAETLLYVKDS